MQLPTTPSFSLHGKRALVTGAGRGIGVGIAAALAAAGAQVVLAARSGAEVEAVAEAIRQADGDAAAVALDVTDIQISADYVAGVAPFDILVNNAGTNRPGPMVEARPADYDAVFGINVRASYFLSQAVVKSLIAAKRPGSIIMASSQMGHVGAPNRTVYCATKHAIEGLVKAMAAELGPHGIRVNSVCPTFIETPMTAPFFKDQNFRDAVLKKIKIGRLGRVEDVMGAVLFLASDASALMTGSALMLDGGWTSSG